MGNVKFKRVGWSYWLSALNLTYAWSENWNGGMSVPEMLPASIVRKGSHNQSDGSDLF